MTKDNEDPVDKEMSEEEPEDEEGQDIEQDDSIDEGNDEVDGSLIDGVSDQPKTKAQWQRFYNRKFRKAHRVAAKLARAPVHLCNRLHGRCNKVASGWPQNCATGNQEACAKIKQIYVICSAAGQQCRSKALVQEENMTKDNEDPVDKEMSEEEPEDEEGEDIEQDDSIDEGNDEVDGSLIDGVSDQPKTKAQWQRFYKRKFRKAHRVAAKLARAPVHLCNR